MSLAVGAVRRVLVLKYKGHSFYEDMLDIDAPFLHVDKRGRESVSDCYSEEEAMNFVDQLSGELNQ